MKPIISDSREKERIYMEFQKIQKVQQGHFITRYDITYQTADQREKVYEMIYSGKIADAKTIIGLLLYKELHL